MTALKPLSSYQVPVLNAWFQRESKFWVFSTHCSAQVWQMIFLWTIQDFESAVQANLAIDSQIHEQLSTMQHFSDQAYRNVKDSSDEMMTTMLECWVFWDCHYKYAEQMRCRDKSRPRIILSGTNHFASAVQLENEKYWFQRSRLSYRPYHRQQSFRWGKHQINVTRNAWHNKCRQQTSITLQCSSQSGLEGEGGATPFWAPPGIPIKLAKISEFRFILMSF